MSLALLLPVVGFYAGHYWLGPPDQNPTGWIMSDMPYYLANAREHFDGDHGFSWTYGNPFSPNSETPRIYFQPQTLALATATGIWGWDPAICFVAAGLIAGLIAIRLGMALLATVCGGNPHLFSCIAFTWWGGVITAASFLRTDGVPYVDTVAQLDPGAGWWFLNWGRNLVLPTEAYYHALAMGALLLMIQRRFVNAVALLALLSISHPFTGIQLLLISLTWLVLERVVSKEPRVPYWAIVAVTLLMAFHLGYYLMWLPHASAEHAALAEQWRLNWSPHPLQLTLAYMLVGACAVASVQGRFVEMLTSPVNRLLICCFAVSFGLANHHWLISPQQPLHFTRGYIWMPLFLLGAPWLDKLFRRLSSNALGGALAVGLLAVGLVDNAYWLTHNLGCGIYLTADDQNLLAYLNSQEHELMIVSDDPDVGYLACVYTPHRVWHGMPPNTPYRQQRFNEALDFLERGPPIPEPWTKLSSGVVYVTPSDSKGFVATHGQTLHKNGTYNVTHWSNSEPGEPQKQQGRQDLAK